MPAGKYTGEILARTRPQIYRRIIQLLAEGRSALKISRELCVSQRSVANVRDSQAQTIAERKTNLATIAARVAQHSIEQIEDELAEGKLKGSQLVPVFGVAVDKLLLLSGEPTERVEHTVRGNIFLRFEQFHNDVKRAISRPPGQNDIIDAHVEKLPDSKAPSSDAPSLDASNAPSSDASNSSDNTLTKSE